jgi:ABC-2 type transport system ATP-binding protein
MDLIKPSEGRVEVLGLNPRADSVALKHHIGYVSENPSLYSWMRVHEIVDYVTTLHGQADTSEADRLVDRFGLDRNARIGSLSRGQAAQVGLVCALGHKPDLLILDEPV